MVEEGSSVAVGACWVNGRLVEPGTATVRADDHAVVVGDGVFETMRIVDGVAFALSRHLRRLGRSATGLGLEYPDEDLIRAAIHEVLAADPSAGLLRITWSSGAGPWGSGRGDGPGTLVVASGPGNVWPAAERVHLVPWARNEHGPLVGLKTTSYAENVLALRTAKRVGCSEALFANTAGALCEGTGTNVFLVVENVLVTPPLSSGCLAGVTRELVMELADVVERDIDPAGFATADEAFLTSSTRDVSPISAVDAVELPAAPGPVTAGLMSAFADLVSRTTDP
jgi:branched-chain amino acid aminotransferase